jgi:hypothetical protein
VYRTKELCVRINNQSKFINNAAMTKLKSLIEGVTNAEKALNESAQKLAAGDDLLPNTGEGIWRDLFLSAKKYSLSCAYPGHDFPPLVVMQNAFYASNLYPKQLTECYASMSLLMMIYLNY